MGGNCQEGAQRHHRAAGAMRVTGKGEGRWWRGCQAVGRQLPEGAHRCDGGRGGERGQILVERLPYSWRVRRAFIRSRIGLELPCLPLLLTSACPWPSHTLLSAQDGEVVEFMTSCNPRGPLVVHISKLFPKQDCSKFDAFGRIMSGTIRPGDRVRQGGGLRICTQSWGAGAEVRERVGVSIKRKHGQSSLLHHERDISPR